jgi:hypothetical protein
VTRKRPPRDRADDEEPSGAEIVAMTIRHGADYAKQHLNALAFAEVCDERRRGKVSR